MLLLDANILIYSFREELPQHQAIREWLVGALATGPVGLPTLSEIAFLRLCTKPLGRLKAAPWSAVWEFLQALLTHPAACRVQPGARHHEFFDGLVRRHQLSGDELVDGWLAALALEQGAMLVSADTGFARFPELSWSNPAKVSRPPRPD